MADPHEVMGAAGREIMHVAPQQRARVIVALMYALGIEREVLMIVAKGREAVRDLRLDQPLRESKKASK